MKEEWYAAKEEIFKSQPKGKAINIENGIIKRTWWGCVGDWGNIASPKTKKHRKMARSRRHGKNWQSDTSKAAMR